MKKERIVLKNPFPRDLWCPFCGVQIIRNGVDTKEHEIIRNLPKRTVSMLCTDISATITIHDKEA